MKGCVVEGDCYREYIHPKRDDYIMFIHVLDHVSWTFNFKHTMRFFWMGKTLPPPNHHNRGKPTNGRLMRWALSPDVNKGHPGEFLKSTLTRKYQGVNNTVDGRNPAPVQVGSLSHYLQGFLHPRWCRISSINSMIHQLAIRTIHGPSHQSISIHSLIRIRHWITESMLPSGFSKPWKSPPPQSLTYL